MLIKRGNGHFWGADVSCSFCFLFFFKKKKGNGLSESGSLALISPLSVQQQRNQQKRDEQMSLLLLLLSPIQKWSSVAAAIGIAVD